VDQNNLVEFLPVYMQQARRTGGDPEPLEGSYGFYMPLVAYKKVIPLRYLDRLWR